MTDCALNLSRHEIRKLKLPLADGENKDDSSNGQNSQDNPDSPPGTATLSTLAVGGRLGGMSGSLAANWRQAGLFIQLHRGVSRHRLAVITLEFTHIILGYHNSAKPA